MPLKRKYSYNPPKLYQLFILAKWNSMKETTNNVLLTLEALLKDQIDVWKKRQKVKIYSRVLIIAHCGTEGH